ncbi:unnamed protein product [Caenorhabditis sp. 36 PRJEB53466]|nr:unnamed protein product [Caenorhabditis sp. 36 PRJEB53466]
MFYAQFVLAKKGPLAKIWLAAHWEKKLTKAQIYETDVPQAIEEVIRPKVKMALRTVGHLLLGIVRIYSKKTRYLLADTNEAYLKMKVNFREGFSFEVDIPYDAENEENLANLSGDFNIAVPEFNEADYNEQMILANVSRLEDITIKEDCNFDAHFRMHDAIGDDGFGDEGQDYDQLELLYGSVEPESFRPTPLADSQSQLVEGVRDAAVDGSVLSDRLRSNTINLSERSNALGDPIFGDVHGGAMNLKTEHATFQEPMDFDQGPQDVFQSMIQPERAHSPEEQMDLDYAADNNPAPPRPPSPDSFALEPLDLENIEGNGRKRRQRKARKLMVDAETMISNDVFREQQNDYADTLQTVSVAPPSRKMLRMCVSGEIAHLLKNPGADFHSREMVQLYRSHLVPRKFDPNFTIQELSEHMSTSASMEFLPPAEPWEGLELNEQIHDDLAAAPGPAHDEFQEDFDLGDYGPQDAHRTLDLGDDVSGVQYGEDRMQTPVNRGEFQNKENGEEEDWADPFGASNATRGRLEAYGFGNGNTAKKYVDDEGKWSKRANQILKKISPDIENGGQAEFSAVTAGAKNRKQAAEQFYSLLSLAKAQAVRVEQNEPYGEIFIRAGDNFAETLSGLPPREATEIDENQTPRAATNATARVPMRSI